MATYEYKVETVREGLIGDKIDSGDLQDKLNEMGKDGWRMVSITPADVKGRMGPGGVKGMLVTFERAGK
jgi:hypothetical protein